MSEKKLQLAVRNYAKAIKLFYEMSDLTVAWQKIMRGLPRGRRYADDRAPTLEEIRRITDYPDRRIKPIVYMMASSGIRVGAWDYLKWGHITPNERKGKLVAAKLMVYAGSEDAYFTYLTPEAYRELAAWMKYRADCAFDDFTFDVKSTTMYVLSQDRNTGYNIFNSLPIPNVLNKTEHSPAVQEVFNSFEIIEE